MRNVETLLQEEIIKVYDEKQKYSIGSEERELLHREFLDLYDIKNTEMRIRAEEKKNYDSDELERMKFEYEKKLEAESNKNKFWMWIGDHIDGIVRGTASAIITWKFAVGVLLPFEQTGVISNGMWRNGGFSKLNWFKSK